MGRPPGIKNGAGKKAAKKSAAQIETSESAERQAPAMAAASSNGPDASEKRRFLEEYRNHRRRLATIMEDAADERGSGQSLLKSFASQGGDPKMLKRMWELTDMSKNEAEADVAKFLGYAVDIGIRVSFDVSGQGNMVDVLTESGAPLRPTTEAEALVARGRAYQEGWTKASEGGDVSDNPHRAGSQVHQEWRTGFSDCIWEKDNGPRKPDDEGATQLERDEAAYRAKGVESLSDDMPADPVMN